jgi:hypothetical protein
MSRSQRQKGKRGEQEVVALLSPVYPEARTKRAGGESASVDRGRDLLGTPGLCVQVKNAAAIDCIGALEEARHAAASNEIPIAFVRRTRGNGLSSSGWCVILSADDFVGMLATTKGLMVAAEEMLKRERGAVTQPPAPPDPPQ